VEWRDEAIVIGAKRHGETSVILELMTRERGRHLGLVRGGRSRRLQPVLQAGNEVEAHWRARLDEQLGTFQVEATRLRAAGLIGSPAALYGLSSVAALLRLLPERDPHPALYETFGIVAEALHDPTHAAALVVRFELALLGELGFGLDISACAVTGATDGLVYVSPRSGRAVSAEGAGPYAERLLPLPPFLRGEGRGSYPTPSEVADGFRLTGYFLERHVFGPRSVPPPQTRDSYIAAVTAPAP
jgi:DNA repair protein RecO (recombination protein O)